MRQIIIFLASGAYSGYSPVASGTAGSVVGIILGYLVCAPLWIRSPAAFVMINSILMVHFLT